MSILVLAFVIAVLLVLSSYLRDFSTSRTALRIILRVMVSNSMSSRIGLRINICVTIVQKISITCLGFLLIARQVLSCYYFFILGHRVFLLSTWVYGLTGYGLFGVWNLSFGGLALCRAQGGGVRVRAAAWLLPSLRHDQSQQPRAP